MSDEDLAAANSSLGRLFFVYREWSLLPLTDPWRDQEAAIKYAVDYGADVVLGIDVVYRATAPFGPTEPAGSGESEDSSPSDSPEGHHDETT